MVVQASGSLTLAANSQNSVNLSYTLPSGYKAILAIPKSCGSWAWVWSTVALGSNGVFAVIKSIHAQQLTETITANVLCIRDI